jgi:hypothetical protein
VAPDPGAQPTFPIRAAFYYSWFPEAWEQRSLFPYSRYRPALGLYDSGSREILAAQVRELGYGGVRAAIVSWWGPGEKSEQDRVPALLATAAATNPALRVALYYEKEGSADPPVDEIVRDLRYATERYTVAGNQLRVDGRPVLFVYNADDQDCRVTDRWAAATAVVDVYLVLKVVPGWESCARQPDGWHEYGPAVAFSRVAPTDPAISGSVTISPGFWRAEDDAPLLVRDLGRWRRDVATMVASGADWHLVTSFNEWGEGTSVEAAEEWAAPSGHGTYLDVLHTNGG